MKLGTMSQLRNLSLVMLTCASPQIAVAQDAQCHLPDRVIMGAPPRQNEPSVRAPIAGYTLAVSWSPGFCRSHRDAADSLQCSGRLGRFGFVLHGLWPEAARGQSPQWCAVRPRPAPELLRRNLCMTPSPGLLEHEWARHGTCMSQSPEAYFITGGRLWQSLRWPDMIGLSYQDGLTAGDLRRALAKANPAWRADQIGLLVNPDGWLQELRLCYSAALKPAPCPARQLGPTDTASVKIWRGAAARD